MEAALPGLLQHVLQQVPVSPDIHLHQWLVTCYYPDLEQLGVVLGQDGGDVGDARGGDGGEAVDRVVVESCPDKNSS